LQVLEKNDIKINPFQLQVLLCEYKEYLYGGFSAGCSHYEELLFIRQAEKQFDMTAVYEARLALFPHKYLGELHGWDGDLKKILTSAFGENNGR
jgi:hypothetical protein